MMKQIEDCAEKGMHKKTKSDTNFSKHKRGLSFFEEPNRHKKKPSKFRNEDDFFQFSEETEAKGDQY